LRFLWRLRRWQYERALLQGPLQEDVQLADLPILLCELMVLGCQVFD
jgi:hypothetical protein